LVEDGVKSLKVVEKINDAIIEKQVMNNRRW